MREKIALKVVKAIYMDRDSSQPMTDISLDIADQILSLPTSIEGLTLGELEGECKRLRKEREKLLDIVEDLIDKDDCQLDHHGYCQTHGWTGELCPHKRGKDALTFNGERIRRKE